MNHEQLAENYASFLVDSMDTKSLMIIAQEYLENEYKKNYTLEQLKTEVSENAPDLLEV